MSKLIDLLKEQKDIELRHAKTLKPTIESIENRLVQALLESIIHDSKKHAVLCQALIDVDVGEIPVKLDLDMGPAIEFYQTLKNHISVEENMIERLKEMLKETEDDRVRAVLEYLLSDEKRHHATLKELSNLMDRDTATQEEYIELFQKFMIVPP